MAPDIEMPTLNRLKDHYRHCIKLSASNKINHKNAFDLQLIDYMRDLVSTPEDGQMNFKMASSALDVGAKIYSSRVDCIQSEAQKVASSILMALDDQKGDQNSDDPNDSHDRGDTSRCSDGVNDSVDLDGDGQKKQRKKRNHRKSVKTIVEDNVIDGKFERMVLGDPFLDGLSKDYDMSCPAALICYNALTQPNGLLTIESSYFRKDYRDICESYAGVSSEQPVTLLSKQFNCAQIIRNSKNLKICPRLEEFLFNDRTTKILGINTSADESVLMPPERLIVDTTKITAPNAFDPMTYDEGAAGCDDSNDNFEDAHSMMGENDKIENLIPNLDQIAASKPTDYGYSEEHHRLLNTWAGPHAWKVAKIPKTVRKEAPKSTRKRVKLEQKPIDFMENFSSEKGMKSTNDKDTRHTSDALRRWKKPFYCQDHNLNEDSTRETVTTAFFRPEDTYNCAKTPADALKDVDKDHNYMGTDENGLVETHEDEGQDGYETPMCGFDDVHDDSDDEFRADPMVEGNEVGIFGTAINNPLVQEADMEFAGENLIEQPYTVAQLNIPFAKIAKKMDVRRLKRVMWDLLLPPEKILDMTINENNQTVIENPLASKGAETEKTNNSINEGGDQTDQQNGETTVLNNGQSLDKTNVDEESLSAVHLQFSNLYGELPIKISSKMANDLSQPIAFVTLLHLANEKNLKLTPKEDLKDFLIEQDETK